MNGRYWLKVISKKRRSYFMRPLINKRKNLNINHQKIIRGSEILVGSENVIILTICFCKVITGFK